MSNDFDKPEMDVYSGVRWSAFSKYGAQGMRFAVSLILARLLAPEYFGLVAMAMVVTGFVKSFKNLGFHSAIIQRKQLSEDLLSTLFWVNLGLCLLVAGLVVAIAPAAARMYDDPRVAPIVAVLALNFVISGFTMIPGAILQRQMAFKKLAIREIGGILVNGSASITLALFGFGVWALVWGSLAGSAAQMMLINLAQPFRPRLVWERTGLKECMGFGMNLTGVSILRYFSRNSDNFIIGMFLGATPLGYYALAYKLMLLPRDAVSRVVSRVLFPRFARIQNDDQKLTDMYLRATGAIAFLAFPLMAGLAVLAQPFVRIFLGDNWLPAVPIVALLAPVGALQSVGVNRGQLFLAKGKTRLLLLWTLFNGPVTVLTFLAGIPWGVTGVAIAYALKSAILFLPAQSVAFTLVNGLTLTRLLRTLAPHAAAALLMAAAVTTAKLSLESIGAPVITTFIVSISVGVATYALSALLIRPPAASDFLRFFPTDWAHTLRRLTSRSRPGSSHYRLP